MEHTDRFLKACRREEVDCTPIWLMRQAGRYMQEYRTIREKYSFLEMCKQPEVAAEVTLQPIDKLGVDAAILFSDILIPVEAMGLDLEFHEGKGPIIHNPVRDKGAVEAVEVIEPREKVPYVLETIKILRHELKGKVPLIGFSGAPFTLASYMVEGGSSKNYTLIKGMMYGAPEVYRALLDKVALTVIRYLNAQIEAGAQAVQIFDSWAGCLGPYDYGKFALPYTKKVIDGLDRRVPVINFATGVSAMLELLKEAGGDVIGIDWRINLDDAWTKIGYDVGIQGNLDPVVLLSTPQEIEIRVRDILWRAGNRPGHIFNLGHGILPQTPVENAQALVEFVHLYSRR